jgi:hypothetical protein
MLCSWDKLCRFIGIIVHGDAGCISTIQFHAIHVSSLRVPAVSIVAASLVLVTLEHVGKGIGQRF